jgi:ferredoxin--NADP+ reductase
MLELPKDEYLGDAIREKLVYSPTVTREPFKVTGRITDLIESDTFYDTLALPPLDAEHDRVMICGGPDMLRDLKDFYLARGFTEGSLGEPGEFVIEKAFVEK